jgi:protein-S-isoprenylcysteine O-methyltransferase Ste14
MIRVFLVLYLISFGVGFLLKLILLKRRTGINPFVLGKGKSGWLKYQEIILRIGLILWKGVILVFIFWPKVTFYLGEIKSFHNIVIELIGMITMSLGLLIMGVATKEMGDSWRIGINYQSKTKLITSGIFHYTRNPIFLGQLISFLGTFFLIPTIFFLLFFVASIVGIHLQIRAEEKFLLLIHGRDYELYMKETPKLFPKIWIFSRRSKRR